MYYCVKCGEKVPDEAKFCNKCGEPKKKVVQTKAINNCNNNDLYTKIDDSDCTNIKTEGQVVSTETKNSETYEESNSGVINKVIIGVFIALIILIAGFVGYYFYEKNNDLSKAKNTNAIAVEKVEPIKEIPVDKQDTTSKDKQEASKADNTNITNITSSINGTNTTNKDDKSSDYIFNNSMDVKLTDSQLDSLSKESLALARNEIFARHGYIFQTEPYKSYFNNKAWYKSNSSFKGMDEELNKVEIYNVQLLLQHEGR